MANSIETGGAARERSDALAQAWLQSVCPRGLLSGAGLGRIVFEPLEPRLLLSDVGGHIAVNTVWSDTSEPYVLTSDVVVDSGATLTVASGVEVQAPDNTWQHVYVDGSLESSGASWTRIEAYAPDGGSMSLADDSFFSSSLCFDSGSSGLVTNPLAATSDDFYIEIYSSDVTVSGMTDGWVYVQNASPVITDSTFSTLELSQGAAPTVTGSTLTSDTPIYIESTDADLSGLSGNTFTSTSAALGLSVNLNSDWTPPELSGLDGCRLSYANFSNNALLIVQPGVTLELADGAWLWGEGGLDVSGHVTGNNADVLANHLTVRDGGNLDLTDSRGLGYWRFEPGSRVSLDGVEASTGFGGRTWVVDAQSDDVSLTDCTVDEVRLGASAEVTDSTLGRIVLYAGSPAVTGCTLTGDVPIVLGDLGADTSGVTGNTYSSSSPHIGLEGEIDGNVTLQPALGISDFELTGDLRVQPGASLTIPAGITIHGGSGSLRVEGALSASGTRFENVSVRAESGGRMDLAGCAFAGVSMGFDAGSGGSLTDCSTETGSWFYLEIYTDDVALSGQTGGDIYIDGAAPTVTGSTLDEIDLDEGAAPTVTGNTFTGEYPIWIYSRDVDLSGFSSNVFSATDPAIGLELTLDSDWTLGELAGLSRYYPSVEFEDGATLTAPSGIALDLNGCWFDGDGSLVIEGEASGADAYLLINDVTVRAGGRLDLEGSYFLGVTTFESGSRGSLDDVIRYSQPGAPWELRIFADDVEVTDSTLNYVTVDGACRVDSCEMWSVTLAGGAPTITNNYFDEEFAFLITDPDADLSGISGNGFDYSPSFVGIEGTVDGDVTLSPVDGLAGFVLTGDLAVAAGGSLDVPSGTTFSGNDGTLRVGGEVTANGASFDDFALIVEPGGRADLVDCALDDVSVVYEAGSAGTFSGIDYAGGPIEVRSDEVTVSDCLSDLDLLLAGSPTITGNTIASLFVEGGAPTVTGNLIKGHWAVRVTDPDADLSGISLNGYTDEAPAIALHGTLNGTRTLATVDGMSEYVLDGDLIIAPGASLSLVPGVTLDTNGYRVVNNGSLSLDGADLSGMTITVPSGGTLHLTDCTMDGARIIFEPGSHGSLSGCTRTETGWTVETGSDDVTIEDCDPDYVVVTGGAPAISGCEFSSDHPLRVTDPDADLSGVSGNTYYSSQPAIAIRGALDSDKTLDPVDGLTDYLVTGEFTVAAGARLSLGAGVSLRALDALPNGSFESGMTGWSSSYSNDGSNWGYSNYLGLTTDYSYDGSTSAYGYAYVYGDFSYGDDWSSTYAWTSYLDLSGASAVRLDLFGFDCNLSHQAGYSQAVYLVVSDGDYRAQVALIDNSDSIFNSLFDLGEYSSVTSPGGGLWYEFTAGLDAATFGGAIGSVNLGRARLGILWQAYSTCGGNQTLWTGATVDDVRLLGDDVAGSLVIDGEASLADAALGNAKIIVRSGGELDLTNCTFDGASVTYEAGSSGTLDGCASSGAAWTLSAASDGVKARHCTGLNHVSLSAGATLDGCSMSYLELAGGAPVVTGCTMTNQYALRITDPDVDLSGFSGNVFSFGPSTRLRIDGTLDGTTTLAPVGGIGYYRFDHLAIAPGGHLIVGNGVTLESWADPLDVRGSLTLESGSRLNGGANVFGSLDATDATVGWGEVRGKSGATMTLDGCATGVDLYFESGSAGSVSGCFGEDGNWWLYLYDDDVSVADTDDFWLEVNASPALSGCVFRGMDLYGGQPTVTGCTLTGSYPISLYDPDDALANVHGNTYTAADAVIGFEGEVSGELTLGLFDGAIQRYRMTGDVIVKAGATLTLESGATLENPYGYKLTVEGALIAEGDITGTGSFVVQNGGQADVSGAFAFTSALVTGHGSRLALDGVATSAALRAQNGGTLNLADCALSGSVRYDADSAGGVVDGGTGSAGVDIHGGDVTVRAGTLAYVAIYGGTPLITGNTLTDSLPVRLYTLDVNPSRISGNSYGSPSARVLLNGTLTGNLTLGPLDGLTHFLLQSCTVNAGAHLTLPAGMAFDCGGGTPTLTVRGRLDATGDSFTNGNASFVAAGAGQIHLAGCDLGSGAVNLPAGTTGSVTNCTGSNWTLLLLGNGGTASGNSGIGRLAVAGASSATGNSAAYVEISGGSPVVQGNTLSSATPLRILEPDANLAGVSGNTLADPAAVATIEGTVDGAVPLGILNGLGVWRLSNTLTVASSGSLALASGASLVSYVEGPRLDVSGLFRAADATLDLEIYVRSGGAVDLARCQFLDGSLTFGAGASGGVLDRLYGNWSLRIDGGSVAIGGSIDVNSIRASQPLSIPGGTVDSLDAYAPIQIRNTTLGSMCLNLGAEPDVTGCTFTGDEPILLGCFDVPLGGIAGNTYTASDPRIGLSGDAWGTDSLGILDGLRDYTLWTVNVYNGADLTLLPGITVTAGYDGAALYVNGSTGKAHATGVAFKGNTSLVVYSGGTLDLESCTFEGGSIRWYASAGGTVRHSNLPSLLLRSGLTASIEQNDLSLGAVTADGSSSGVIDLADNWWGTVVDSEIRAKILDHSDDAARPTVVYSPFLTSSPAVDIVPPMAAGHSPTLPVPSADHVLVTFTEAIDTASVDFADLYLIAPDASVIPVTAIELVQTTTYRLTFAEQTVAGTYTVHVGPGVPDLAGNPMDDAYEFDLLVDPVGARILSHDPGGDVRGDVGYVEVTFSEAIRPESFTPADVTILGPDGQPVSVNVSVAQVSGNTWGIWFDPQHAGGTYTVRVGPDVLDIAGNPMDQSDDGVNGQPDDAYDATFTIVWPDLVPVITAPASGTDVSAGSGVTLSYSVTNIGTAGMTGAQQDWVYISTDAVLDDSDTFLGWTTGDALAAGAHYDRSLGVTVPSWFPDGDAWLIVHADWANGEVELSDANNVAAVRIHVHKPDLAASFVSAPASALANQYVTVTMRVDNVGEAPAGGYWQDALYFSADDILQPTDTWLWDWNSIDVQPASAGGHYERTAQIYIPYVVASGTYYLIWKADYNLALSESDEDNNTVAWAVNVQRSAELSVTALSSTVSQPITGQTVGLRATVRNTGPDGAVNVPVRFYLGDPAAGGVALGTITVASLAAGYSQTVQFDWDTTGLASGTRQIYAVVDPDAAFAELYKGDNQRSISLNVDAPSVSASWTTLPGEWQAGQSCTAVLRLANTGGRDAKDVSLTLAPLPAGFALDSSTPTLSGDTWSSPTLAAGAHVDVTLHLTLAHTISGAATLGLSAQFTDAAAQSYAALDPSLHLSVSTDRVNPTVLITVTPSYARAAAEVVVETSEPIQGTPTIAVVDSAGHSLAATLTGQTATRFTYSMDVSGATQGTGRVDVTVTDLAGNAGTGSLTFIVDRTAPTLSVSLAGQLLDAGTHTLTVTTSEPLPAPPTVSLLDSAGATISAPYVVQGGNVYYYTVTVTPATAQGAGQITVSAADFAGNATSRTDALYVDSMAPTFTLTAPPAAGIGTFYVDLTPDETLPSAPALAAWTSAGQALSVGAPTIVGATYRYAVTVISSSATGNATVQGVVRDYAGNQRVQTATVLLDTTPPVLTIVTTPNPPSGGASVTIEVTSDEALMSAPTLKATLNGHTALALPAPTQSGNTWTWVVPTTDVATVSVEATDVWGNTGRASKTWADASIVYSDITLSTIPTLGSDVTAHAVVRNLGPVRVEDVLVRFFVVENGKAAQLGPDQLVSLDAGASTTVSALWPSAQQTVNSVLAVSLDYDNVLAETSEANNLAIRGPVLLSQSIDQPNYLLSGTSGLACAYATDTSSGRMLDASDGGYEVWIENQSGVAVTTHWAGTYNAAMSRFEAAFDPSAIAQPGIYYVVGKLTGANFAPAVAKTGTLFVREFTVTAATDQASYERGGLVHITGRAMDIEGNPIANAPCAVVLMSARYGARQFAVTTDSQGYLSYYYQLTAGEGGHYDVTAKVSQGRIERVSPSASFDVRGLWLQSEYATVTLWAGSSGLRVRWTLDNVGDGTLTGIVIALDDQGGSGALATASLDLTGAATTLAGRTGTSFYFDLQPGQTPGPHAYRVLVTTAEGESAELVLNVTVKAVDPVVTFSPWNIETTTAVGAVTTRQVTVTNTGWRDVTDAVLVSTAPGWATITGAPPVLGTLAGAKGLSDEGFGLFGRYSLIVRVGLTGPVYQVGSVASFNAGASGELYFRINEDDADLSDNSGAVSLRAYLMGQALPGEALVGASGGWQASGIQVVSGQLVRLEATGLWKSAQTESRDPNGAGCIVLTLTWAPTDLALADGQPRDWSISLTGSNISPVAMQLRSWAYVTDTGSAGFTVTNPLGQTMPNVPVALYSQQYNPLTHSFPTYQGTSDAAGYVSFAGLAPGSYGYAVQLPEYQDFYGTFSVGQGAETPVPVALKPNNVSVEWVVQETTVQDVYRIVLQTTYQVPENATVMPARLIAGPIAHVLSPGGVAMADMQIRNAGSRTATNVVLVAPGEPGVWQMEFLDVDALGHVVWTATHTLDRLLPGETVSFAYRIRLESSASGGPWDDQVQISYYDTDADDALLMKTTVPVGLSRPNDTLYLDPPSIVQFSTHGWGIVDFWSSIGEIQVTNGSSGDTASVSSPLGVLGNFSIGLVDIIKAIATAGASEAFSFGASVVTGSFSGPDGTSVLRPGETGTMSFTSIEASTIWNVLTGDIDSLLGTDFISIQSGVAGFYADWVTPDGTSLDRTWHAVPIMLMSVVDLGFLGGAGGIQVQLSGTGGGYSDSGGWGTGGAGGGAGSGGAGGGGSAGGAGSYNGVGSGWAPPVVQGNKYVTFNITQEASFDRQAFTGSLVVSNGSSTDSLEHLRVDIEVLDSNGNVIATDHRGAADFYFADPDLTGLSGVDGNGALAPGAKGTMSWLIIPTEQAGGRDFQLRACVTWDWAGIAGEISSLPVAVHVAEQPKIELQYYMQPSFGADEPFYLGVIATNTGSAAVHNFTITSGQPEIQWNLTNVPGAYVVIDDSGVMTPGHAADGANTLVLDFGTIEAGQSAFGWWELRANPGGTVSSFRILSLEHDESLGGARTALLNATASTGWIDRFHLVAESTGGDSALFDTDEDGAPDQLFDTSDFSTHDVACVSATVLQAPTFQSPVMVLSCAGGTGYTYTRVANPGGASMSVVSVQSSGGAVNAANWWVDGSDLCIVGAATDEYTVTYVQSAPTHTGDVRLDRVEYAGVTATALVTLSDADLDLHVGGGNDTVTVRVTSAADPAGETITLAETSTAGVFTGTVGFESSPSAGNGKVSVESGRLFTVTYSDAALADGSAGAALAQARWNAVPAPSAQSVVIDDGTGQCSCIRTLTVVFADRVTLDDGAIRVVIPDGNDIAVTLANPSADGRTWRLTFSGTHTTGGGLDDGWYQLRVAADLVHNFDGGAMAADYMQALHRMLCDSNGDGMVDETEFSIWQAHYDPRGRNGGNGPASGDWNGDGKVDSADVALWQESYDANAWTPPEFSARPIEPQIITAPLSLLFAPAGQSFGSGFTPVALPALVPATSPSGAVPATVELSVPAETSLLPQVLASAFVLAPVSRAPEPMSPPASDVALSASSDLFMPAGAVVLDDLAWSGVASPRPDVESVSPDAGAALQATLPASWTPIFPRSWGADLFASADRAAHSSGNGESVDDILSLLLVDLRPGK